MSDDHDEDFDDDYSEKLTDIQLGFVQKDVNALFLEKDWSKWDGGRVGGRPIWLDKSKIPEAAALECKFCAEPNVFLLQIYCPLDEYDASAFHRCLYVFCCRKATCTEKGSIQCLRSQLPKDNKFYKKVDQLESETAPEQSGAEVHALHLCEVCGLQGSFGCSACSSSSNPVRYCSKKHQQLDWKFHKQVCGKSAAEVEAASATLQHQKKIFTFAEYDICIEEEDLNDEDNKDKKEGDEDTNDIGKALKSAKINPDTIIWEDAVTEGGDDEKADADLKQGDYEKALGNEESDPLYSRFLSRVRLGGDKQVLRYYCGPRTDEERAELEDDEQEQHDKVLDDHLPLAVSSTGYVDHSKIPACEHCQAPRAFEFQIMPQLLHFLKVDQGTSINKLKCLEEEENKDDSTPSVPRDKDVFFNKSNEDIDWGSIDVFTCSKSCQPPRDTPYMSEYCWRQPPPVVSGHQLDGPSSSDN